MGPSCRHNPRSGPAASSAGPASCKRRPSLPAGAGRACRPRPELALLSKGSIFSTTHCTSGDGTDRESSSATAMPASSNQRLPVAVQRRASAAPEEGVALAPASPGRRYGPASSAAPPARRRPGKATASDKAMPRRRIDRDGAYVMAPSGRDEGHRQQRGDAFERGEMVGPPTRPPPAGMIFHERLARFELLVVVDVLHHHDGVVDQGCRWRRSAHQRHAAEREAPGPVEAEQRRG